MKYKIKELDTNPNLFTFDKIPFQGNTIIHVKYKHELLEFQSPKMCIESVIKENDKEYFLLQLASTRAHEIFCSKVYQIEDVFSQKFGNTRSAITGKHSIVKIPCKNGKPLVKVYKDGSLFNYYHITQGMEIMCLIEINKLWIKSDEKTVYYNLNVKEISIM
jgi:hypothetical protein